MKKTLLALAALVATVGCADPAIQFCEKSAECLGYDENQVVQTCHNDDDEEEETEPGACDAESDALLSCIVDNGTCDEVEGSDVKVFGVKATAADGPCRSQIEERDACLAA